MQLDATRLSDGATIDADVCIVGAGPAGLVAAHELAARGREVVLLDSGASAPDAYADAHADAQADALNDGDVVGDPYAGLRATRARGVGGTMRLWNTAVAGAPGAKWVPLDPVDVDGRWPFGFDALRPYYERAQRRCGLGPMAYDAASWARPGREPLGGSGNAGGCHLVSRVYQFGARHALLDPTVAFVRASGNATLLTRATVVRLDAAPGGRRVARAVVASPDGGRRYVRARRFVLAGGAVENARLLLVSDTLGYEAGLVGRCFMEHPRDRALSIAPRDARVYREAAFHDMHAVDGTTIAGRLALAEEVVRAERLNASATLVPRPRPLVHRARGALGPLGRAAPAHAWLPAGGPGWSAHPVPARVFDGFGVLLNVEQPPRPENRVTLGRRRDAYGVPVPVLHWRWAAEDHARLARVRALVAAGLESLGLGRVTIDAGAMPDPNAHHHAGTTRMHADPREGVVDADCRVHGLDDVYVAGASVFPTAGFANPMLTIVAMALRLADHVAET